MKLHRRWLVLILWIATGLFAVARASAVSALEERKDLTPENLIRSFAGFKFELNAELQDAETFLQRRCGDCDDFASLASRLLTERGYKTKLVVVMMERQTHVVCYVPEAHGFLDFNHRADAHPIIESDGSLESIAQKVAGDFRSRWEMASEVKFQNQRPIYLDNVFPSPARPTKIVAAVSETMPRKSTATNELIALQPISSAPVIAEKIARAVNSRVTQAPGDGIVAIMVPVTGAIPTTP